MNRWPARRLIVALAALTWLFDLAVLLPGGPSSSRGELVVALLLQTLVLWGLWRGSAVAWFVALAFAAGQIVSIALFGAPLDLGAFLTLALSGSMAAILCTSEVRSHVDGRGRRVRAERLPYSP